MELKQNGCLIVLGFILIVYTHSQTTPSGGSQEHTTQSVDGIKCVDDAHCPVGMCCVHNPLSRPETRKRILFSEYDQHDHGYCRRARKFNESCWPLGHNPVNPDLYEYYCPCEHGLECRGLVVHETAHQIVHKHPKCQDPEANIIDMGNTPSGQVCSGDSDCPTAMCCVQHPLTSRRRQESHGYCRNEKKLNETCSIKFGNINTNDFYCDCGTGLECRGTVVKHYDNGHGHVHVNPICQVPQE